jgi:hypothetical protein
MCKKYVISDGKNYIYVENGLQNTTSNISKAQKFATYEKASNFIKSMKKSLRMFNWKIKELGFRKENLQNFVSTQNIIVDNELDGIINKIKEVEDFTKQLKVKKQEYIERYNTVKKEITDIEHAAEFYSLNAAQGYKIYKMLHEARIERRKCKDGLAKISYILDGNFQDCCNDRISRRIEGLNHRQYEPRVLKELFNV